MRKTIPFTLISLQEDGYHCITSATVNGSEIMMVVDTGASLSCFDINFLQQIVAEDSIKSNESMTSGIGTNSMNSVITRIKEFSIGPLTIQNYRAVGIDMTHIHHAYEQIGLTKIEGILGADILARHQAVIDYRKRIITLNSKPSKIKLL